MSPASRASSRARSIAVRARPSLPSANPITATRFEVKDLGNNEAEISYIGDKTRVVWSKWVDSGGKWQIDDVAER